MSLRGAMTRIKTAQINLKIMPELKEAAEKAAAADQRTLTSLIEKLLTAYCEEHGFLPSDGAKGRKAR
jgi:hypothetical protein